MNGNMQGTGAEAAVEDGDGLYANVPPATTKTSTTTFTVRHMRVLDWPAGRSIPHNKKTLLTLYSHLAECQKNRSKEKDRFLIHCL